MTKKNFIIEDLKKVKLYKNSNLNLVQNYTRNGNVNVIEDKKQKFFFLEKILTYKDNFYKYKYHKTYPNNKNIWQGKFYGKKIVSPKIFENKKRALDLKSLVSGKQVLDFGCGFGDFASQISKFSKKTFVYEKSKSCKIHIKKKLKNIKVLDDLDNHDNFFDIIILIQTLHYLPEQIKCLQNLRNKLKVKGKIIIEVPSSHDILLTKFNLQKFRDFTFCKESLIWHNKVTLKKFLQKAKFKKIQIFFKQRYDLNNHMGWLMHGKPGGHEFLKNFFDSNQRKIYEKFLKKNELTDTLFAIAEK